MPRESLILVIFMVVVVVVGCSGSPKPPSPTSRPVPGPASRPTPEARGPNARVRAGDTVEAATAQAERGDVTGAIAVLRRHLEESPGDHKARLRLGRFLDYEGRADEAIALWKAGLAHERGRRALHLAMAYRLRKQAEDGPNVVRRRETVTYRPSSGGAAEKIYRMRRAKRALEHFQAALKLEPADSDALAAAGGLQNALKRHAAAAATWRAGVKRFPKQARFVLGLAYSLELLGRTDQAVAQYQKALGLDPRIAVAHAALAKLYAKQGKAGRAREARARARFFDWLPAFVELRYDAKVARTIEALERKGRRKVIERLLKERSKTSSALLAALIIKHRDHGELEDRMFVELAKRQRVDLLRALLENGQSTCTLRGAAHALAQLRDPKVFEVLVRLLRGDTRAFFWIDVANALAKLGDPRAVPHLVEVLAPEHRHKTPKDDPMMGSLGLLLARQRAAAALGHFEAKEGKKALERGLKNPDLALHCHMALHRLTRGAEHLSALRKGLVKEYSELVVEYVRAYDPKAARGLAKLKPNKPKAN
jgi:tetratricopeptide (TPR) repeat protein